MEKKITAFVRSKNADGETCIIQIEVLAAGKGEVSAEVDRLEALGFEFNQIEPDCIYAELQINDYQKAFEIFKELRKSNYLLDEF